jgi:hypothetical protein
MILVGLAIDADIVARLVIDADLVASRAFANTHGAHRIDPNLRGAVETLLSTVTRVLVRVGAGTRIILGGVAESRIGLTHAGAVLAQPIDRAVRSALTTVFHVSVQIDTGFRLGFVGTQRHGGIAGAFPFHALFAGQTRLLEVPAVLFICREVVAVALVLVGVVRVAAAALSLAAFRIRTADDIAATAVFWIAQRIDADPVVLGTTDARGAHAYVLGVVIRVLDAGLILRTRQPAAAAVLL